MSISVRVPRGILTVAIRKPGATHAFMIGNPNSDELVTRLGAYARISRHAAWVQTTCSWAA